MGRWELDHHHSDHAHRDLSGGWARAAVFGVSDGLVSNVALVLGVASATTSGNLVLVSGVAGLVAGALSMAAGEYVSVQAQRELVERELEREADAIRRRPELERAELAGIYEHRGLSRSTARQMADEVMSDPDVALEVHAREELGVDPGSLGAPFRAAGASFVAFALGAVLPLLPWIFGEGDGALVGSVVVGAVAAAAVGAVLAAFTGRSVLFSSTRQLLIAAVAAGATYLIGALFDVSVG